MHGVTQKNISDGPNRGKSRSSRRENYDISSLFKLSQDLSQIRGRYSPLQILIITIGGIVIADVIAMIIVYYYRFLPYYLLIILDVAILTLIVSPLLYFFSLRPLLLQIKQRQQSESIIQSRLRLMQYSNSHTLDELLQFSLDEIETLTGSTIGFFHFLEADQKSLLLQAWSTNTLKNMYKAEGKDSHYDVEQVSGWADVVRQRQPVIHNNYAALTQRKGLPEEHALVVRELVIPILRNNEVVAILGVGNKPQDFTANDMEVVSTFADFVWDIVEHKRDENAKRKSEEKFRTLVDWTYDWELWEDPHGNIVYTSPSCERITGYTTQEFITDSNLLIRIVHSNDRQFYQDHRKIIHDASAGPMMIEYRIISRDGSEHWIEHICRPLFGSDDRHLGRRTSNREITERKQAEKKILLLTTALEAAANGIILVDKEGTILWSNPAFNRMTGYPKDEILGQNPRILKSGKHDLEFYRNLWDTILAAKVWHGELINRRKNGSLYDEEQIITPVIDQDGKITNFISIRQDITEHKQAEDAFVMSEQKYRSLVIATTQIVWQTNSAGEVVDDIPTWRAFTGQSVEEIMGQGWINAVHPADRQRTAEIWAHAVDMKTLYETEYRIKRHTGEYRHFSVRGVPVIDNEENITCWIGTCTDITEKKRIEVQLIHSEKHAVIGRMVGSVTHEINNPLQTVKNCLYLIKQEVPADSPLEEPLRMATSETQRLANLVAQLRQLYLPQQNLTVRPHELIDIIEEVHNLIIQHLENSHVIWHPMAGLQQCSVYCVRDQIIEVFLNICINAIEAMQTHGGTLSVDMVLPVDRDQVGVKIIDSGPGINPEIMEQLFEPFTTTKENGLGLGLSICYGIIQRHGGQMLVDSQPGEGTTFTIWLPLAVQGQEIGE